MPRPGVGLQLTPRRQGTTPASPVPLTSRRKVAQGPSGLARGSLSSERPCRLPVPWPVQLCCLPPGARDQSCPPHACFPHAHDRPAAQRGPAAQARARAGFPSVSTDTAHGSHLFPQRALRPEGEPRSFTKNQRTTRVLPRRRWSLLQPPTHTGSTDRPCRSVPAPDSCSSPSWQHRQELRLQIRLTSSVVL